MAANLHFLQPEAFARDEIVDDDETLSSVPDRAGRRSGSYSLRRILLDAAEDVWTAPRGAFKRRFVPRRCHRQDEAELMHWCEEESMTKKKQKMGGRQELEAADLKMANFGSTPENDFLGVMGHLIQKYQIDLPTIQIRYDDVRVTTMALKGSAAVPSVGNSFVNMLRSFVCMEAPREKVTVVDGASGVLLPGRLTLLLGPPSSGKTSFMKYLCGRLTAVGLKGSGDVRYNGHTFDEFNVIRTSANCGQIDVHIPNCTVLETLDFAHRCTQGSTADLAVMYQLLLDAMQKKGITQDSVTERATQQGCDFERVASDASGQDISDEVAFLSLFKEVGEVRGVRVMSVMRLLGIGHTKDTVVGDAMLRGVSGGERKRVTVAEMIVGGRRALFLDEISTGLDSATLFSIITSFKRFIGCFKFTMLVSLLQPPPEVFWQFDDLILMAEGKVTWHGPCTGVVDFLSSLRFVCPPRKDVPSFLQEVVAPSGQLEFASDELLAERGFQSREFEDGRKRYVVPIDEMCAAYWKTDVGQAMKGLLDTSFNKEDSHPMVLSHGKYALSTLGCLDVVVRRQWLLFLKDMGMVRGRLLQCVVVGLLVGGLFWQRPKSFSSAAEYFGAAFLLIMFSSMGQMVGLISAIGTKGVWFKHRDNSFYPAWAHAVSLTITQIPFQCVDTFVWLVITYFMIGFSYDAGRFFSAFAILFGIQASFGALFRAIGHASPDAVSANTWGGLLLLVLICMSGFTIPKNKIPPWWIWAYWMSPYAWGMRSLVVNEMTSADWSEPWAGDPSLTVGEASLLTFEFNTEYFWVWCGFVYLMAVTVAATLVSAFALKYLSGEEKIASVADEEELEKARADAKRRRAEMAAAASAEAQRQASAAAGGAPPEAPRDSIPSAPSVAKPSNVMVELAKSFKSMSSSTAAAVKSVQSTAAAVALGAPAKAGSKGGNQGDIPFQTVTLVWQNLQYFVPNPAAGKQADAPKELELLKTITGWAKPGELTALMGGSGAGKTTLMDCVAGRKTTGMIKGDITVNGHPKEQRTWSRVMGYVEQMDIHTPAQTIIEALMFSARLRLSADVSNEQMRAYVDNVVQLVDLTEIMFALVGTPGVTGLSVEQRKRLTIANEMVANPSVMFMDEPTSGLDARAASIVMRTVRNVGNSGRAVVVTIHQPSIEIFEAFDNLLLLQRGGRTTYFGPLGYESAKLVGYLQAVPGCEPMKAGANPATWMLEVTGGAVSVTAKAVEVDWPQLYKDSELGRGNDTHAQQLVKMTGEAYEPLKVSGFGRNEQYAATFHTQIVMLARKFFSAYWRMPSYNHIRYVTAVLVGVLYGSIYYSLGRLDSPTDQATVQSIGGVVYLSVSFMGMSSMMSVMPIVGNERVVYYREQAASYYNPWAYGYVISIVEIPYQILQIVVSVCIMYPMVDFIISAQNFFYFLFMALLSLMMYVAMGTALMYVSPSQQLAQVSAAGLNFLFNIFNGYVLPYPAMAKGFQWINRISPTTWVIYGLVADQLAGRTDVDIVTPDGQSSTVASFVEATYGYIYSFRFWCLLIVVAYILFFRVLSVLALRYISFLKR